MAFKSGFSPKAMKVPKVGGGGNALMNMMLAQSMLPEKQNIMNEADVAKQGQKMGAGVPQAKETLSQIPQVNGKTYAPPGTELSVEGLKIPINREMTVEESKGIAGSDAVMRHLNYIKGKQSDPNFRDIYTKATFRLGSSGEKGQVLGFPLSFGDTEALKLAFSIQDLSNRLLYLRSGAQINEKEFERLSRSLPSWSDISDDDPTYEALNYKLDQYQRDAQEIKNNIVMGGNYNANMWEGEIPEEFIRVNGLKAVQLDNKAKEEMMREQGVIAPPTKSPASPVSPIPGMNEQVNGVDPLDELRQLYLKK